MNDRIERGKEMGILRISIERCYIKVNHKVSKHSSTRFDRLSMKGNIDSNQ